MSFTLADLRKSRSTDFSSIANALKKTTTYEKDDDSDFFKLERDKAGNGSAVLRFLPAHPDDDLPWVQIYSHAFQGPTGRWYIENSRTTLGETDPVAEENSRLWKTGLDSDKEIARKQKRRLHYVANVLVVSNPAKPDLEGTVVRYKFGKKIFEKLMESANPTFADEVAKNPFDPFTGANFKLRMRQVEGYPNYDKSEFESVSPIAQDEEEILSILNKMKPLKELVDQSKFKPYDVLEKKFKDVMHGSSGGSRTAEDVADALAKLPPAVAQKSVGKVAPDPVIASKDSADDSDDIEDYFKSMAS